MPLAVDGAVLLTQKPLVRSLRPMLRDWPDGSTEGPPVGLVVSVDDTDEASLGVALGRLRPGGWLIELRVLAAGFLHTLLALRGATAGAGEVGYAATARFSELGVYDLQQWLSVDPPDLLVTCGRRR